MFLKDDQICQFLHLYLIYVFKVFLGLSNLFVDATGLVSLFPSLEIKLVSRVSNMFNVAITLFYFLSKCMDQMLHLEGLFDFSKTLIIFLKILSNFVH
jgi:hypothetical protein